MNKLICRMSLSGVDSVLGREIFQEFNSHFAAPPAIEALEYPHDASVESTSVESTEVDGEQRSSERHH